MAADSKFSCVTVFGGSGFLGSVIVNRLSAEGIATRVADRHPDNSVKQERSENAGEIIPVYADVRDETSVGIAIDGCDAVVNAVGLYVEVGAESFEAVHELGALNIARQSAILSVSRLVHISGIGADQHSPSRYIHARAKGELLVSDIFPRATILRPSVLFGVNDKFVNTLAMIIRRSPVLPLFGSGQTKLQPIFVGDVAEATLKAMEQSDAEAKIYELGGPRVYSYSSLVKLVLAQTKRTRLLLPVPYPVWEFLAVAASILRHPPLTRAQVTLMRQDNVVTKSALSLEDLGVSPTALEDILPEYAL